MNANQAFMLGLVGELVRLNVEREYPSPWRIDAHNKILELIERSADTWLPQLPEQVTE